MNRIFMASLATLLLGFSISACKAEHDHDHGHADADHHETDAHSEDHAEIQTADHSKFGHLSAVYLCGDEELQTRHTDEETTLAFRGNKIDVSRTVSVLDNAFIGESFKGTFNGQPLFFKGKGYDASLTLGGEVTICEKQTCIPLGGPH